MFTVEYSVRAAQMAVYGLIGLAKEPTKMYHGDRHPVVMVKALKAILEDGTRWSNGCGRKKGAGLSYLR